MEFHCILEKSFGQNEKSVISQALICKIIEFVSKNGQSQILLDIMGHELQTVRQKTFIGTGQKFLN